MSTLGIDKEEMERELRMSEQKLQELYFARDDIMDKIIAQLTHIKQLRLGLLGETTMSDSSVQSSMTDDDFDIVGNKGAFTGYKDRETTPIHVMDKVLFDTPGKGKFQGKTEGIVEGLTKKGASLSIRVPGIEEPTWRSPKKITVESSHECDDSDCVSRSY